MMYRFIQSNTYKDFLLREEIQLNDRQWAKIIDSSYDATIMEKKNAFLDIMNRTKDKELRNHLKKYVEYYNEVEKEALMFYDNAVYHLAVYIPEDDNELNEVGIFSSISLCEKIGKLSGNPFRIRRFLVQADYQEKEPIEPDDIFSALNNNDLNIYYNGEGKIKEIELLQCEIEIEKDNFLNEIYINFPRNYKNGDIIRLVGSGKYGIVHVPKTDWVEQLIAKHVIPENEELVEIMDEEGEFGHDHILPFHFDIVEYDEIPKAKREVLICASSLIAGERIATIDDLQYSILEMKQKSN